MALSENNFEVKLDNSRGFPKHWERDLVEPAKSFSTGQEQIQQANLNTWPRQAGTVTLPWQCKEQSSCFLTLWTLLLHY